KSSVELNAAVPASSIAQPTTLLVTVETPAPGGGRSNAANLVASSPPADPLIDSQVTVGSFPSGVSIDPVRHSALITNQGSDTVSILDLATRNVTEVHAGRNPDEGLDVDSSKDLALIANAGSNDVSVINLKTN